MGQEVAIKLEPYQSFESVDEMLETVNQHIRNHTLTKSAIKVLRFIAGRSKMVPGAAWLKVETIAKSKLVSVSERTVQRAIRKLEQLGILEVHTQMRETLGGQGANVYVILPVSQDVTPDVGADLSGRPPIEIQDVSSDQADFSDLKKVSAKKAFKSDTDNDHPSYNDFSSDKDSSTESVCTKRTGDDTQADKSTWWLDKHFASHMVPVEFRDLVGRYFNDALVINRLWRKSVRVCRMYTTEAEVPVEIPLEAFKQTVAAYKEGRIKGEFEGYFWGTLVQMFVQHQRSKVKSFSNLFVAQTV